MVCRQRTSQLTGARGIAVVGSTWRAGSRLSTLLSEGQQKGWDSPPVSQARQWQSPSQVGAGMSEDA